MERAQERGRDTAQHGAAPNVNPVGSRKQRKSAAAVDRVTEPVDIERFPVMIRLSQIQGEIRSLADRIEGIYDLLDRMPEPADGRVAAAPPIGSNTVDPIPPGITARANPMTHPVTPHSAGGSTESGRDEVLANVRALFMMRRRPWWQRLPDLLRG